MIAQADTLIFVISPSSVESKTCNWELAEAHRQGKRIIPVLLVSVGEAAVPRHVSRLNYIFFDKPDSYDDALDRLVSAIETDIGWIRQHTHLSLQSNLWKANNHNPDYLLRGAVLREAEGWLAARPRFTHTVEPTDEIIQYLDESRRHQALSADVSASNLKNNRPTPHPLGTKVFLSYRRADTSQITGRIYDKLVTTVGENQIFFDVDTVPIATDFVIYIRQTLAECAVILVVIGPHWSNARRNNLFSKLWQRRTQADFVETEVCLALDLGVPIIPILADGASMPPPSTLPASIRELTGLNAAVVRAGKDFHADMSDVITEVKKLQSLRVGALPSR